MNAAQLITELDKYPDYFDVVFGDSPDWITINHVIDDTTTTGEVVVLRSHEPERLSAD